MKGFQRRLCKNEQQVKELISDLGAQPITHYHDLLLIFAVAFSRTGDPATDIAGGEEGVARRGGVSVGVLVHPTDSVPPPVAEPVPSPARCVLQKGLKPSRRVAWPLHSPAQSRCMNRRVPETCHLFVEDRYRCRTACHVERGDKITHQGSRNDTARRFEQSANSIVHQ